MKMQFLRLAHGKEVLPDRDWVASKDADYAECCKDALLGFYDVADGSFWPKKAYWGEHGPKAPEVVRIINDLGAVVASYSIKDFIRDTGRHLQNPF